VNNFLFTLKDISGYDRSYMDKKFVRSFFANAIWLLICAFGSTLLFEPLGHFDVGMLFGWSIGTYLSADLTFLLGYIRQRERTAHPETPNKTKWMRICFDMLPITIGMVISFIMHGNMQPLFIQIVLMFAFTLAVYSFAMWRERAREREEYKKEQEETRKKLWQIQ